MIKKPDLLMPIFISFSIVFSCFAWAKPEAKTPQKSQDIQTLRFKSYSCIDTQIMACEAFSMLIPYDWKFEGGIQWRLHPTMPAATNFKVKNPKGVEELDVMPALPFAWNAYTIQFFPPGSNYLGNEVRAVPSSVSECIKNIIIPRYKSTISNYRVVNEEAVPELENVLRGDYQGAEAKAAKMRIEYQQMGKWIEEELYSGLIVYRNPSGGALWLLDKNFSARAEKGRLDENANLFLTMLFSFKINIHWFNRYYQLVESIYNAKMQEIRNLGVISKIISNLSDEINEIRRNAYERQQASQERSARGFSEYIRGVEEYHNPIENRSVQLPSGYNYVWTNSSGEYYLSNNSNFNPNVGSNLNWQEIKKK